MQDIFNTYIKGIIDNYNQGEDREVTHRTPIENLLKTLLKETNSQIKITHEPKQEKGKTPDFRFALNGATLGYIETKRIDEDLEKIRKTPQIKGYLKLCDNIIITDYINWIWLNGDKKPVRVRLCYSDDLKSKRLKLDDKSAEEVYNLIRGFLEQKPVPIGNYKEFAKKLAMPSKELKKYLFEELTEEEKRLKSKSPPRKSTLWRLYEDLQRTLTPKLEIKEYADTIAQTLTYSLFIAKLNSGDNKELDLYNFAQYIPQSFDLIKALANFLRVLDNNEDTKWIIEEILAKINNINTRNILESLSHGKTAEDAYLYLYEEYLNYYDKKLKIKNGVYYTPPEAVKYIVESTNEVLKQEFGIKEGLADEKVTLLDFACGTGTFLLEVFKTILDSVPQDSARLEGKKNHLLNHIYGFEFLFAPYTVAHLKLSQFLKERGIELENDQKFKVFLTNTLTELSQQQDAFIEEITEEGENAQEVKDQPILVIIGNPPYNVKSKNPSTEKIDGKTHLTTVGKLLQEYKPRDEQNIQPLDDDYIKFISFAHNKMKNTEKGVIGIITNNSYLDGLIHRKMRNDILKDFSSIYIINLHGNSNIGETTPEGGKDENVFDIKQGVAIALFVKGGKE